MNAIKCSYCYKVLVSTSVHDFRVHRCTRPDGTESFIAVDGGPFYKRRVGEPRDYEEIDE